jgi:two-component system response regulator LytT
MTKIAIVEDEEKEAKQLSYFLSLFFKKENDNGSYELSVFPNAVVFLTNYKSNFDIVLMDIDLPGLNGMEASKKLREIDDNIIIIFVTNMAQFAVSGYSVGALDFIIKPVIYNHLELVLKRALKLIQASPSKLTFRVIKKGQLTTINISDLQYVEVVNHTLFFHKSDDIYSISGSLNKIESQLKQYGFARCNNCYLVNLRFVTEIEGMSVTVGKDKLQISQPKKKPFKSALAEFLGGRG